MWRSAKNLTGFPQPVSFALSGTSNGKGLKFFRHHGFALFAGLVFAVITEVYQIWIPGRAFNPVDMGLNVGGIVFSGGICYFWMRRSKT
jgi:VanZ family protein